MAKEAVSQIKVLRWGRGIASVFHKVEELEVEESLSCP